MSIYPITVRKVTLGHRQGTKEYHLALIETDDGRAVLINRWGKVGQWGQMAIEAGTADECGRALQQKRNEKEGRGYGYDPTKDKTAKSLDLPSFKKVLGDGYFYKLGAHMKHLDPDADATGVREPVESEYEDEAGRLVHKGYQPKHTPKIVEPTPAEINAGNPDWGTW